MNFKNLSDDELNKKSIAAVQREISATVEVLYLLMENDRRKLFAKLKFKSLHHYAEDVLKYPGKQAYLRISAMRVLREFPQLEHKIRSGALSISHLNDANTVFRKKKSSRQEKWEILNRISNTSTREAHRILVKYAPGALSQDQIKLVAEGQVEFKFVGSIELHDKLKEISGFYAHHQILTLGDLLSKMADHELERIRQKKTPKTQSLTSKAETYRYVWSRDGHKCTKCGSTHALQIDHIVPRALGGENVPENLRLLCRNCNQRAAVEVFGAEKMSRYTA